MTNKKLKIFIAGHKGMVGSAVARQLKDQGVDIITRDKIDLDLLNQMEVHDFFSSEKIDQVYLAAARVGGIHANDTYPAEFIYQNLMIQNNVIHSAFLNGVKKLLFLGSSCIYPKNTNQPINEEELLNGKLEHTNEPYAIAKISGIKMCESYNRQYGESHGVDYRCVMPTNLYGPRDNYHPENSHVIPGLIQRFHNAKIKNLESVTIWGTGTPRREFLYVDDMARAAVYVMNLDKDIYDHYTKPTCSHINVGIGTDISINEIAELIKAIVGYNGNIELDTTRPDGIKQKLLDSTRLRSLGWEPEVSLKEGLVQTYKDFLNKELFYKT